MMDESRHPVDLLADEFAKRLRQGEAPSIDEYAERYAEHADLIRAVFPSVAAVERVANQDADSLPTATGPTAATQATGTPATFGDFTIVRRIGSGGMGVVYEAIQRSLRRRVALKVMNESTSVNEKHRLRFRREAESAAGLHHTNIVPIFGIGEDHGLQYYAMQLIEGATLQEAMECLKMIERIEPTDASKHRTPAHHAAWRLMQSAGGDSSLHFDLDSSESSSNPTSQATLSLADSGIHAQRSSSNTSPMEVVSVTSASPKRPFAIEDFSPSRRYYHNVAHIVASVAGALDYAHHSGVLHRDIKPANLLLDREGTIWVTDFGLARRNDIDGQTQTGELLGTLRYMAPEQIRGGGDHRMDIYSLGLTLFEMLTLQQGLESPKARLIDPHGHSVVGFSASMHRKIPRDLQTIVLKACAIHPADRYQRAGELEQDLRRFMEDRPIHARRAGPLEQLGRWARRNPSLALLTTLSFGLLLTIAGLLAGWNRQQQSTLSQLAEEYERAEFNLREKTHALELAEREQARAEKNMQMALEAFDQIMTNIVARGQLLNTLDLSEDDSPGFIDATLTQADVELLLSLASFFDRFAAENTADLRIETAVARRRVGEIQHRIGKLDDAAISLSRAVADFESIRKANPGQVQTMLEEIAARMEWVTVLGKKSQLQRANAIFLETRQWIENQPALLESTEGQFALANLLANMVNVGPRMNPERRRRPPMAIANRNPSPPSPPPGQLSRLRRESDWSSESIAILERLVQQNPNQSTFQLATARAFKDRIRLLVMLGEPSEAEQALLRSISILETLLKSHPDSATYRYELADILSINLSFRTEDEERCIRALELCDQLLEEHPNTPQYQALKATVLSRLAMLGNPLENRGEKTLQRFNEAIDIQSDLARRYPEVPLYPIALVQYHLQQSEIYYALRRFEKARESMGKASQIADSLQNNGTAPLLVKSFMDRIRERLSILEEKTKE